MTHSRARSIVAVLLAITLAVSLSACGEKAVEPDIDAPAALSVQELLELRANNSTDTAAYLQHVESTAVAEALAVDSAGRAGSGSPTPEWDAPAVTRQETSTAEVSVRWRTSEEFSDWPAETVFFVRLTDGHWRIVDARETSSTAGAQD